MLEIKNTMKQDMINLGLMFNFLGIEGTCHQNIVANKMVRGEKGNHQIKITHLGVEDDV